MRSDVATTRWAAALLLLALIPLTATANPQDPPAAVTAEHVDHLEWRNIGPGGVGGRIVDFAVVETDPRIMYVATAYGGATSP